MPFQDGWPEIWHRFSDEQLEQNLYEYLLLTGSGPGGQDRRIDQLIAEAERRGKPEIVERAKQRIIAEKSRQG